MNTTTTLPSRCASCTLKSLSQPSTRTFSTSSPLSARRATVYAKRPTQLRQKAYQWLYEGAGASLIEPIDGLPNYIGSYTRDGIRRSSNRAQRSEELGESNRTILPIAAYPQNRAPSDLDYVPFPSNPHFESQPVLTDEMRDEVNKFVQEGNSLKAASFKYHITVERAGAIVRLKAVEKQWIEQGKTFAHEYARAVTSMLPVTQFNPASGTAFHAHEPIHDLPVARTTKPQIFHITSESHQVSRAEAGEFFQHGLPPADERIHHVEAVRAARAFHRSAQDEGENESKGKTFNELLKVEHEKAELSRRIVKQRKIDKERKATTEVQTQRALFKFKDVLVDAKTTGQSGRKRGAVGERYGAPHMDRKRGLRKIIQRVI